MTLHIRILLFWLIFNVMPLSKHFSVHKLPLWTWDCIDDKCVPTKVTLTSKLQSLVTCDMICAAMPIWPQPTGEVYLSTTAVPIRADLLHLQILSFPSRPVREHFRDAFKLFREDLLRIENRSRAFEEWHAVIVRVAINESGSADPMMRLDTDESYRLLLQPKTETEDHLLVEITSNSFCGARHALETLAQLIWHDPYAGSLYILDAANVDDAPRFRYRGLMLDTARNYFPSNEIIQTIDAMAASKLNTFHWHATDSQAFSLQLSRVPQLAQFGAYGKEAVYTPKEISEIVRHARTRGIRVLLEVDLPSHIGSAWDWGPIYGLQELAHCVRENPWSMYCKEPPCGQINPLNPHVYDLIEHVYTDIVELTGVDDVFHLGGSDISVQCWAKYFKNTDPVDLWVNFTLNIFKRLELVTGNLPNLVILWSTPMSERLKLGLKQYAHKLGIQVRSLELTQNYVTGVKTILSHEDAWDLNSGFGVWYEDSGRVLYNSWQRVYEHRPWGRKAIASLEGGEATVWSSMLSAGGLDARIWPRAAALAERLWSDRTEGATRSVHARLDFHRSRLLSRGIQAAPLWSMWCTHNPFTC